MSIIKKIIEIVDKKTLKSSIFLFFLMLVTMVLETLGVGLVIPVVTILFDDGISEKIPFFQDIIRILNYPSHLALIAYSMGMLITVYFLKSSFVAFFNWRQANFILDTQVSISEKLFSGYMNQSYSFHLRRNSASLIRNIVTEVNSLISCFTAIIILVTEILVFIGISILLLSYEFMGSLIVILLFSTLLFLFYYFTKNMVLRWGKLRQEYDEKKIQSIQEGLGSIKEAKIYKLEKYFINTFETNVFVSSEMGKKISFLTSLPRLWLELLIIICMSSLVIYLVYLEIPNTQILTTLGLFAVAAFRLLPSFNKILSSVQLLRYNLPVVNLIHSEVLLSKNVNSFLKVSEFDFQDKISIKNLSFAYDGTEVSILKNISLEIKKGKKIGFVGSTGAGKTTLIDSILGLIEPLSGEILVDKKNIQNNIHGWQKNIGYVPQNIYLSDSSLKKNIAFGIADKDIDDLKILTSIKNAQLEKFVNDLPDGIDTFVGERGVRISGGQKQRIGIARALYNNPSVIVLDEATSALDGKVEFDIMGIINSLDDKTILIIAHRLSTLDQCDKIYEIKDGLIFEKH